MRSDNNYTFVLPAGFSAKNTLTNEQKERWDREAERLGVRRSSLMRRYWLRFRQCQLMKRLYGACDTLTPFLSLPNHMLPFLKP